MPNLNLDVFYNSDVVNFTVSRGSNAPKAKPAWKVRNAPKLPPKEPPQPAAAKAFGPKGDQKSAASKPAATTDAPKKKAPKLEVRSKKPTTDETANGSGN